MNADDLTPRARDILESARRLLEEEGPKALTMRRLAERLGIRAPSIYKHFPGKQALESALISVAFEQVAALFAAAIADAEDPAGALAAAYRGFAREHPHLYRLMTERPLDRANLAAGAEDGAARPVYEAFGRDPDLARAAWAFAHGMTILELNGRFPPAADLDAAWRRGLAGLRP